ncbi:MAG: hypothetical protein HY907_07250 [Deltaproteobacteria bacterium]|nr:hypothetical protein [Deltaproteobacteria bacterium]
MRRALASLGFLLLGLAGCGGGSSAADGPDDATGPDAADEPGDGDSTDDSAAEDAGVEVEGVADDDAGTDDGEAEVEWATWDGDAPDVTMMTKDEHVASCMRTRACFSENPQQLATCTSAFASINGREIGFTLSAVASCVNAAGADCAAIRDCLTNGEEPAPCVPLSTPDRCDGTVLRQCSRASTIDFVFDCARLGLDCHLDRDGAAVCGLGICDPETFRWTCRGDTVVSCDLGVISLALCDAAGMACVEDDTGGHCAGTGGPCTDASDPRRCEGDRVRGCIGGFSADIDCNDVIPRWTCGDREGDAGCVAPGDECTAVPLFGSDIDESCDGDAVVSCLDGWIEPFSCSALGLGPCAVLPSGRAARCTVP